MNLLENDMNQKILTCLSQGKTIKEIALLVYSSKRSVERSIRKMKGQVGCKNNVELVSYAHKNNLINTLSTND